MKTLRITYLLGSSFVRHDALKVGFTIFGMILGIAVYVAIRLANETATSSFADSASRLTNQNGLRISSSTKEVSEVLIPQLQQLAEKILILPFDKRFVSARSKDGRDLGMLQVIGIDMLGNYEGLDFSETNSSGGNKNDIGRDDSERGRTGKSEENTSRTNITELLRDPISAIGTSALEGIDEVFLLNDTREAPVRLIGTIQAPSGVSGNTIFLDISKFQELFGSYGKLNSLLLRPASPAKKFKNPDALREELGSVLTVPHYLSEPDEQSRHAERLTEAFRLNLHFLAGISLLVGALLIYNTVSYIILKHRRDFGILRSLGAKPGTLIQITLLTCLALGSISSVLGLGLGYAVSQLSVKAVVGTISTLYTPIVASSTNLSASLILECLLIGPAVALLGGLLPCLEIASVTPRESFGYQNYESSYRKLIPWFTVSGVIALLACYASTSQHLLNIDIRLGFISPLLAVAGSCLLLPRVVISGTSWLRKTLGRRYPAEILLAIDHITMTLRRNVVAISAMMIALGMFLGLSIMIASFRQTVQQWIQHITPADIYISSAYAIRGEQRGFLPDRLLEVASASDNIEELDWIASRKLIYKNRPILLSGIQYDVAFRHQRLLLDEPLTQQEERRILTSDNTAFISEAFANRFGLKRGATLKLPFSEGSKTWTVGGVFYDYSSDQGVVYIPQKQYAELYNESRVQGLSIYLKNSSAELVEESIENIRRDFPNDALVLRANATLRREVLEVFDKTFQITYALQAIALLISTVTIVNTILMLLLERAREFGVMRAIGASRRQIVAMIRSESLVLGCISLLAGIFVGLLLALILVFVINRYFFAWSMAFILPLKLLLGTILATLLLSYVAGRIPGMLFARGIDAKVLRYE